jgi:hypothetical protein
MGTLRVEGLGSGTLQLKVTSHRFGKGKATDSLCWAVLPCAALRTTFNPQPVSY